MTTGQLVKETRMKTGLSQRQLAKKAGITSAAISQWENDKREIPPKYLLTLAVCLNTSATDLLKVSDAERDEIQKYENQLRQIKTNKPDTVSCMNERLNELVHAAALRNKCDNLKNKADIILKDMIPLSEHKYAKAYQQDIRQQIQQQRKFKNMTQQQLADEIGMSVISIRRYENGKRIIPEQILSKIKSVLDLVEPQFIDDLRPRTKELITIYNSLSDDEQDELLKRIKEFAELTSYRKARDVQQNYGSVAAGRDSKNIP